MEHLSTRGWAELFLVGVGAVALLVLSCRRLSGQRVRWSRALAVWLAGGVLGVVSATLSREGFPFAARLENAAFVAVSFLSGVAVFSVMTVALLHHRGGRLSGVARKLLAHAAS